MPFGDRSMGMKDLFKTILVKPGAKCRLSEYDPEDISLCSAKEAAREEMARDIKRLAELQEVLYAEDKRSVLIILQAMDGGGKDGTIKHVMSGLNPQGCEVTSFKVPSAEESDHDFLWRIHKAVPRRGNIGIFNRSHYEDVLVVRVHNLVPTEVWKERYDQIDRFEKLLSEMSVVILKFFLHISKEEQRKRLQERLKDPTKNWKFSELDLKERELWDDYQQAYEDALSQCSTQWAPWYVIPANHKWYRNWLVARTIVDTLESLKLSFPVAGTDLSKIQIK
jgi:PPK2 family polyphosphate:nucleotide phosphotransferase